MVVSKAHVSCFFLCPVGVFSLNVPVEALFFVGNQLIATSHTGKVGVWNAVTKHWQVGTMALELHNKTILLITGMTH